MQIIIGLLFIISILMVILCALTVTNIYLTYRTLIRPESPCFAGSLATQIPRFGVMEVDPQNPYYAALSKMNKNKVEGTDIKKPISDGNYL